MATKKKTKKTATKNAVAKRDKGKLPALASMYERDAGAGFEYADADSYAIPFLVVLQKMSPQCDDDQDAYIKGAKPGMFLNTATQEIYDGKVGVVLVPCSFRRQMVEWVPRDEGGGFRGSYDVDDVDFASLSRDESGRFVNENGNHLVDTRYHYCLLVTENGKRVQPVVFSLSSTQIKKSRNWMTLMNGIRIKGRNGKEFCPPMFSHAYRVTSVGESNEKGDWKGVAIEIDHQLEESEMSIYEAAKKFITQVESGVAKTEPPQQTGDEREF